MTGSSMTQMLQEALARHRAGDAVRAAAGYTEVLRLDPGNADALYYLGMISCQRGRFAEGAVLARKSLGSDPRHARAHVLLGRALNALEQRDDALASFERAIALAPELAPAHGHRADVLSELGRDAEAIESYDRALALDPELIEDRFNRGTALLAVGRYDEALASFDRVLAARPDLAKAKVGRGNVLFALKRDDDAVASYDAAIALDPDLADAYFNKSFVKLMAGDFTEGWALHEWRWRVKDFAKQLRHFSQPLWLGGEDLAEKTILIYSEQGFGDTIQFCRYLPLLNAPGGRVVFETHPSLAPLFTAQNYAARVIAKGDALPKFDVQCPLMSLPLAFKTTLATVPAKVPYLAPAPEKSRSWRARLGQKIGPRIGLVWSGNPSFAKAGAKRVPLDLLLPITAANAEWYSLQMDVLEEDRGILTSSPAITDHTAHFQDFSDTAALIAELDLVIAVDTAVAHLAGALGRPVWILLPLHADFRWLRDRQDNPWYPSAKLFRQTREGAWQDVIDQVAHDLQTLV